MVGGLVGREVVDGVGAAGREQVLLGVEHLHGRFVSGRSGGPAVAITR